MFAEGTARAGSVGIEKRSSRAIFLTKLVVQSSVRARTFPTRVPVFEQVLASREFSFY